MQGVVFLSVVLLCCEEEAKKDRVGSYGAEAKPKAAGM